MTKNTVFLVAAAAVVLAIATYMYSGQEASMPAEKQATDKSGKKTQLKNKKEAHDKVRRFKLKDGRRIEIRKDNTVWWRGANKKLATLEDGAHELKNGAMLTTKDGKKISIKHAPKNDKNKPVKKEDAQKQ